MEKSETERCKKCEYWGICEQYGQGERDIVKILLGCNEKQEQEEVR